jgi:anti-anti-sigma factor
MFNCHYKTVGKNQDVVAMVLTGTLDEDGCKYLLGCVEDEILGGRRKLVLDFGGVTYMSSLGLGTLIRVNARMKARGGDVKLAAFHGAVAELMGVVGFNPVFQVYPNLNDAIAAHGG